MIQNPITRLIVVFGIALLVITVPATDVASEPSIQMDNANTSVSQSPGAQLTGAVITEGATLETEHQRQTLKSSLAQAQTADRQAAVIATSERRLKRQLNSLEARSGRLDNARRTGQIEQDRYRAETTVLNAKAQGITEQIGLLRDTATRISYDQLEAHDTSIDGLNQLAERAHTLSDNGQSDNGKSEDGASDDEENEDGESENEESEDAVATVLLPPYGYLISR